VVVMAAGQGGPAKVVEVHKHPAPWRRRLPSS